MSNINKKISARDFKSIKKIKGNRHDQENKAGAFDSGKDASFYHIPENQKDMYHLLLVNKVHLPEEERYERTEFMKAFEIADYNHVKEHKGFKGRYSSFHVVHDPTLPEPKPKAKPKPKAEPKAEE